MSDLELPFAVEYAKTGRASCKGCKTNIGQGTVRIARMVQSPFHDGKLPNWFHQKCFFLKHHPADDTQIAGFSNIRNEDQVQIKKKIAEMATTFVIAPTSSKSKKRKATDGEPAEVKMTAAGAKDYGVEYAKSGVSLCRGCEQKIIKGDVRVKKIDYETEVGMKYGGQPLWHHLDCFSKLQKELGWFANGNQLPGYKQLREPDQELVKNTIKTIKSDEIVDPKKVKVEKSILEDEKKLDTKMAEQNKKYFKNFDKLQKYLSSKQMIDILVKNRQEAPTGQTMILNATADLITFGALKPCPKCKGQLVFNSYNYKCSGKLSEWVQCENIVKEPERVACIIPKSIKTEGDLSFLKSDKLKVQVRVLKDAPSLLNLAAAASSPTVKIEKSEGPRVKRELPPLYQMEFAIIGKTKCARADLKLGIEKLGGKLVSSIHEKLAAIISNKKQVEQMNDKMIEAKQYGIQIIPETFLKDVQNRNAIEYIKTKSLCDWGTDPAMRISREENKKSTSSSGFYTKSVPKSVTLKLKNGTVVDPASGLDGTTHVFVQQKVKYFAILGRTDIQSNKNSYYKLQLLESENRKKYYLFRSWGRIGTTIGGNKVESFGGDISEAIIRFNEVYEEHTGNHFMTKNFVKHHDRYIPLDIDYGTDEIDNKLDSNIKSELEPAVENLMKLLFDVQSMKNALVEFELDMEKMPLGKISQKQLHEAMKILKELSELVKNSGERTDFLAASNKFYTLIPHSFGIERLPMINTTEMITQKTEMLESLMELEFAYKLLKTETDSTKNPLDGHYKQLKTTIKTLDRNTDEFKLLEKYVKNTHGSTHRNFDLEIEEIFKVEREGEQRRYKPFKKLHNRKLLWHGSRLTNYIGILSHGLKIAPPDAPVTGYMFGKGIYFADMVSKSANYCCTTRQNSTGLMLLCQVALGDTLDCTRANYITQLPNDKHSCRGLGTTYPCTKSSIVRADGVELPVGKPVTDDKIKSSLLYNEYIVYDVSQVNIEYLFRLKFIHKY